MSAKLANGISGKSVMMVNGQVVHRVNEATILLEDSDAQLEVKCVVMPSMVDNLGLLHG